MKENTYLYHCTKFDSLCKIMESKCFLLSYCLEELSIYSEAKCNMAYAVTCFADLSKSDLEIHMKNFKSDSYIRLDKKWAINQGVSPVIYYADNSLLASILRNIIDYAILTKSDKQDESDIKFVNSVQLLMGYLKQYNGRYFVKSKNELSNKTVQFYNEREWRYLPIVKSNEAFFLEEHQYHETRLKCEKENELKNNGYVLNFTWNDIEEIGITKNRTNIILEKIQNSWSISKNEVLKKIRFL